MLVSYGAYPMADCRRERVVGQDPPTETLTGTDPTNLGLFRDGLGYN